MRHKKNAFTLVELIVVFAAMAALALLAVPRFLGYTKQAQVTRLVVDARALTDASQIYYLRNGDWPRASDTPYTADQVIAFSAKVSDQSGKVITLDPAGNYYDIDVAKLNSYVALREDPKNFVLQNPVGSIYFMDPVTNVRFMDKTPPTGSVTINSGGDVTNNQNITLSFTYQDNSAGTIQMRFGEGDARGAWQPAVPTVNWTLSSGDGPKTINVEFKDQADNVTTASAQITLDTVAPSVLTATATPQTSSAAIAVTTNEATRMVVEYGTTSAYGLTTSSSTYTGSNTINLVGLNAGVTYHYRIKATDGAGNVGYSADKTFTTTMDAPVLTASKWLEKVYTGAQYWHYTLTWNAIPWATSYEVYAKGGNGTWTKMTVTTSTSFSSQISAFAYSSYSMYVRAVGPSGYKDSNIVQIF